MMKKAYLALPSAIWTLVYVENKDGSITIHDFNNADQEAYIDTSSLGVITNIVENDDKILIGVGIDGQEYGVANPEPIMSYKAPL